MNKAYTHETELGWAEEAVFYHIYPLGLLGAPGIDDPGAVASWRAQGNRASRTLLDLKPWVDHCKGLGCTALYLGPVFQSSSHGYDTIDYTRVDDRLGNNRDLAELVEYCHERSIKVVLDGVFNHAGRNFFAFKDLQEHGEQSMFKDWFSDIDFSRRSPVGDKFSYRGWHGHYDLVKFNLEWPWARDHLLTAVEGWIEEFGIDGLRLDAADCLSQPFISALAERCRRVKPEFWLMGEVVHGNYRDWVRQGGLDSVTNYEAYKGLYSSFNEGNFFEIAHTLRRQFAKEGIYRNMRLYNFADNHDVNRIASTLTQPEQLGNLYGLLFTMPGIPSLYYGSEWGIQGKRLPQSDRPLRPALTAPVPYSEYSHRIALLAELRRTQGVLVHGEYHQVFVSHRLFCFARVLGTAVALIIINSDTSSASCNVLGAPDWMRDGSSFDASMIGVDSCFIDVLNGGREFWRLASGLHVDVERGGMRILLLKKVSNQ